jgi:hypothetical protein
MMGETSGERNQRRLHEWLERQNKPVTVREVQQNCRWLKAPGTAEAALQELVNAGQGRWCDIPSIRNGGRPSQAFERFR